MDSLRESPVDLEQEVIIKIKSKIGRDKISLHRWLGLDSLTITTVTHISLRIRQIERTERTDETWRIYIFVLFCQLIARTVYLSLVDN